MPMRGLHDVISSPLAYDRLLEMCRGGQRTPATLAQAPTTGEEAATGTPTFVVIPALEFVGAYSSDDPRIHALLDAGDKQMAADLVISGDVRAFHAEVFPAGHGQSNLDRWCSLPADAPPYEVTYAQNYEPYGVFCRQEAPMFDERFRGFGLDKVAFCWHLHQMGWAFRTLPAAFLVDLPHPCTRHRKAYRVSPAFRASVDGLFQRFVTEIGRSVKSHASSHDVKQAWITRSYRFVNGDPRDYEVLAGLFLLAWGDAWIAGAQRSNLVSTCGGGWELKGGIDAWVGLVALSNGDAGIRKETGGYSGGVVGPVTHYNGVAVPSRMVGSWAYVRVGGRGASGPYRLLARSVIRPHSLHGVMRYWVCPRWDLNMRPRGKLPGLGISGDVRFLVRWRSGSLGYCCLMRLGQPLQHICKVLCEEQGTR